MSQNGFPARGLPLGWRLGIWTSAIVLVVLGAATGAKQWWEIERGRDDRTTLLSQIVAPLAWDVESAPDLDVVQSRLRAFEEAHHRRGYHDVHVVLRDSNGLVAGVAVPGPPTQRPATAFVVDVPVRTPLLAGGGGRLEIWHDDDDFQAFSAQRWRLWGLSLLVAAACILLSLQVAFRLLIGRPLARLLEGVRQMEMGYWTGLEMPSGAWELRWLAWRFRNLGSQLEETVRRLVEADRRALLGLGPAGLIAPAGSRPPAEVGGAAADEGFRRKLLRRYLVSRCRYLEARGPGDSGAREAARETWDRDVLEAERLGDNVLKSRLEDAALKLLEPQTFDEIRVKVAGITASRKQWVRDRDKEIRKALHEHRVAYKGLQYRVKHTAGIWRKMKTKGLALEQIHDIFAFRVLLATEQECYQALQAIHDAFDPLLLRFKDYIARPKENGYQSLHTCIRAPDGLVFEVQIRTVEMHDRAEGGEAAHWRYKAQEADWTAEAERLRESFTGLAGAFRRHRPEPVAPGVPAAPEEEPVAVSADGAKAARPRRVAP